MRQRLLIDTVSDLYFLETVEIQFFRGVHVVGVIGGNLLHLVITECGPWSDQQTLAMPKKRPRRMPRSQREQSALDHLPRFEDVSSARYSTAFCA